MAAASGPIPPASLIGRDAVLARQEANLHEFMKRDSTSQFLEKMKFRYLPRTTPVYEPFTEFISIRDSIACPGLKGLILCKKPSTDL
jgi:hypothetical protein